MTEQEWLEGMADQWMHEAERLGYADEATPARPEPDVKAQELSYDEWRELLEPYGWAEITTRAPAVRFQMPASLLEYEIRMMLKLGTGDSDDAGEWARRSGLLEQARKAVEAVQARGCRLPEAPRIEFRGQYVQRLGVDPVWFAEAELYFTCELR